MGYFNFKTITELYKPTENDNTLDVLRYMQIKLNKTMYAMAKDLDMSTPEFSNVKNLHVPITNDFLNKFVETYGDSLNDEDYQIINNLRKKYKL